MAYRNNNNETGIIHSILQRYLSLTIMAIMVCMLFIDDVENKYVSAIYHRMR
jgi:hypothetical protein